MKRKQFILTLLGTSLGVLGAYWLTQLYHRLKAACPPFRRRVYTSSRALIEAFRVFWEHPEDLRALRNDPQITRPLAEKLMLTVSGANGSRYWGYAQGRLAMRHGLSPRQVQSLLRGEINQATLDEAPALIFARDYVEQDGNPDAEMVQQLVDTYGMETARNLVTYVRLIDFSTRVGNTFDALLSRLLGCPSEETTWKDELAVLAVFTFGILPLALVLIASVVRPALPQTADLA